MTFAAADISRGEVFCRTKGASLAVSSTASAPRGGSPRIEIVDLVKSYRREGGAAITPVNHIDLSVAANELVVLLGPSGCGKTTLLRCVAGLERPDAGEIVIDGKTVFSSKKGIYLPADQRAISMVFQSYALWPHMTVSENVAYPLNSRRAPKTEIAVRVQQVLEMVGVGGLGQQYPSRISGGQQQRVALARALVGGSSVVLFDEPLSNVDAQVRAQLRFELQAMQRRLGFSGLYVTHDQTEAMELGHRVAVLDAGVMAALGTPHDVYNNPPNDYVARFVGVANIWGGTVTSLDGSTIAAKTPFGTLLVAKRVSQLADIAVGDAVSIVARPENLRIDVATPGPLPENAVAGTVEAQLFSGAHTEIIARLADGQLATVWVHDQSRLAALVVGTDVHLSAAPTQLRLVPASSVAAP
ncbi:MAG: sfuC [Devosia sp.]|nr:sfuC [Devosia sp.]